MRSHRFDTFKVTPENQAAFDRCRRVANLEEGVAAPLVLVGGTGQGKSHLLWSIVNEVREKHPHTALALVTAREFPERVKALAENPEPIQKSRHAILLVDALHQFRQDAATLEAVVEAFLANHFAVVLATPRPPIQIESLSLGFKRMLTAADIVTVGGRAPAGSVLAKAADAAPPVETPTPLDRIETLQRERDNVAARYEKSQRRVTQLEEELAALLQKYATLEGSERQARESARDLVRLQGEREALRMEAANARDERDAAKAALKQLEAETQSLREQLGRAQDLPAQLTDAREERDAARAEAAQAREALEAVVSAMAGMQEEMSRLRGQLDAAAGMEQAMRDAQAEAAEAREETQRIAEQAAAVVEHLVALSPEAADAARESYALIGEFLECLREHRSTAGIDLPTRLDAIATGVESAAQRALRAQLAELASEREMQAGLYEEARAEQARLDVERGLLEGRVKEAQRERDAARQTKAILLSELDALRETTREDLAKARRHLAAIQSQLQLLSGRYAETTGEDAEAWHELAGALGALATDQHLGELTGEDYPLPEQPPLFEEAERGRALLQAISRQLLEAGRAPESTAQTEGPLTRAVNEALAWDEPESDA
ncbi:MAG: hypothetical protein RLZZ303_222 [Candidatus Hydrogenedentota bacterium]